MKPISIAALSGIARAGGFGTSLFDTGSIEHEFGSYHYLKDLRQVKLMKPVDFGPYQIAKEKTTLRDAVVKAMESNNADIIALSVISGQHVLAEKISRYAKEHRGDVKIIWGGPYVNVAPEKALEQGADFVCVGEGLVAFEKFLKAFANGGDLTGIENIWSLGRGSEIIRNDPGPLKENLDDLPYLDWEIFSRADFLKPYDGKVLIGGDHMVTWGCPNGCAYCINEYYRQLYRKHGRQYKVRRFSVDRIVGELKSQKEKYGLEFMKFCDENFLLAPVEYLREFAAKYSEQVVIGFTTACHPKLITEEKINLLKEAGCVSLSIGIETGDGEYRRKILNRTDSIEDVERAFRLAEEAGIRTMAFNMMGLPFYTREIYDETIRLNRRAGVKYPTVSFFFPFMGTKLREVAIENNFYNAGMDKGNPNMKIGTPSLVFEDFTEEQLKQMFGVFALYVKLPECYHKYIRRSESTDLVGVRLRDKLIEIYERTVWKDNRGTYVDDGKSELYLSELEDILSGETQLAVGSPN
jgi:radical SAM superfamily enzyme YgiQ (UPF0313 family)